MTDSILLDGLLALIILLAMPIGFWRGLVRETFAAAGILLGFAVAGAWEDRWGRRIADLLDVAAATGRFVAGLSLFLLIMLVVGYGGGALAAPKSTIGLFGRIGGAFVAAANAVVVLVWALGMIARDLATARSFEVMEDGIVAGRLLGDGEWVMLSVAGGAAAAVVVAFIATVVRGSDDLPAVESTAPVIHGPGQPHRLRPVRFPTDADAGKFEPEARQYDPATGRFGADAPRLSTSMPLTRIDQARWTTDTAGTAGLSAWDIGGDPARPPRNGRFGGREWLRRSRPQPHGAGGSGERPSWPDRSASAAQQCRACGSPMTAADAFCPRCGTSTSQ